MSKRFSEQFKQEALLKVKGQHPDYCFVFRGKPFKEVKTSFKAACVRAGLGQYVKDKNGLLVYEGFWWHGFRHTWATWHAQAGTPMEVLKELGGCADLRMVLNYYRSIPSHVKSFANNIDKNIRQGV